MESFARSGLRWQTEIYSANAGHDIQGLEWNEISQKDRDQWIAWAKKTMELKRKDEP